MRTDGTQFFETGVVSDSTLIIIPEADGSLPGGMTAQEIQQHALSARSGQPSTVTQRSSWRTYSAAPYAWSFEYSGTNIFGSSWETRVSYGFTVTEGTNQMACGQGLTYYRGYNGSSFGVWSKWVGLGCAVSNSPSWGGGSWGNVAATAKFKAQSVVPHVAVGQFYSGGY